MFNLAINRDVFLNLNPVRRVKFFREVKIGLRVVSAEEGRAQTVTKPTRKLQYFNSSISEEWVSG